MQPQPLRRLFLFALTLLMMIGVFPKKSLLAQNVIHVDAGNTTGTEDGTVQFPYTTIQAAIDTAASGDSLKVARGTYNENISVQNKGIHLFGSFSSDFSVRDLQSDTTHIQGNGTDAVVTLLNVQAATVDGFRITGGTRSSLPEFSDLGGGFYIEGGSPTISNNTIENNDTRDPQSQNNDVVGGGIYAAEAEVSILNNMIRNNVSGRGAGIAINGGTAIIRDNIVRGNTAVDDHGGGLYLAAPSIEVTRNRIEGNEVGRDLGYGWGGGILVFNVGTFATLSYNIVTGNYAPSIGAGVFVDDGAEAVLNHELIYRNQCTGTGGVAVYVDGAGEGNPGEAGSKLLLSHCTIVNNNGCGGSSTGNGLFIEGNSEATVENSIFWGNGGDDFAADTSSALNVTFTNSEEAITGTGNISQDPLFASPQNDDYHLRSSSGRWNPEAGGGTGDWVVDSETSPCIDAGNPASDYSQEPLPNGGRVNMGVYGNTSEASRSMTTSAKTSDQNAPDNFIIRQNYPNPFNPVTTIEYVLQEVGTVTLTVYDGIGRQVAVLVNAEYKGMGTHVFVFDGFHLHSGVYYYTLHAGSFTKTRKMVLSR